MNIKVLVTLVLFPTIYGFKCPTNSSVPFHFADPKYCAKFYICYQDEQHSMTCPNGKMFDIIDLICKPRELVECDGREPINEDDDLDDLSCDSTQTQPFLNPDDCQTFYLCVNGTKVKIQCRDHLLFNAVKKYCDWPLESNCCEHC